MKFGERIRKEGKTLPAGWRSALIDYDLLKRRLKDAVYATKACEHMGDDSQCDGTSVIIKCSRNSFQHLLDSEIEKSIAFYKLHSIDVCDNVKVSPSRVSRFHPSTQTPH